MKSSYTEIIRDAIPWFSATRMMEMKMVKTNKIAFYSMQWALSCEWLKFMTVTQLIIGVVLHQTLISSGWFLENLRVGAVVVGSKTFLQKHSPLCNSWNPQKRTKSPDPDFSLLTVVCQLILKSLASSCNIYSREMDFQNMQLMVTYMKQSNDMTLFKAIDMTLFKAILKGVHHKETWIIIKGTTTSSLISLDPDLIWDWFEGKVHIDSILVIPLQVVGTDNKTQWSWSQST